MGAKIQRLENDWRLNGPGNARDAEYVFDELSGMRAQRLAAAPATAEEQPTSARRLGVDAAGNTGCVGRSSSSLLPSSCGGRAPFFSRRRSGPVEV